MQKIIIEIEQPHGSYWTAHIFSPNKSNDAAATGQTPKDAVMAAAMNLLSWLVDGDTPKQVD